MSIKSIESIMKVPSNLPSTPFLSFRPIGNLYTPVDLLLTPSDRSSDCSEKPIQNTSSSRH